MKKSIGSEPIPIIDTTQLESELLYQGGIPISSLTANAHEYFHINRVEDYFRMIDFPLPSDLQPRRMTVYNFFFLTKGVSTRSKGLDTYEFNENTFFFVPAHQITTHKFIRKDVEGFYCHFNIELLTDKTNLRNLLNEFTFLEFNSYPLVKIDKQTRDFVIPLLERLLKEYKSDEILQHVNNMVYNDAKISEVFATLSILIVNNETKKIKYSGAGDLPDLWCKNELQGNSPKNRSFSNSAGR